MAAAASTDPCVERRSETRDKRRVEPCRDLTSWVGCRRPADSAPGRALVLGQCSSESPPERPASRPASQHHPLRLSRLLAKMTRTIWVAVSLLVLAAHQGSPVKLREQRKAVSFAEFIVKSRSFS